MALKPALVLLVLSTTLLAQRMIDTVAGGHVPEGVLASSLELISIGGLSGDASGNLYFSDAARFRVRRIRSGGIVDTVAGTGISTVSGDGGVAAAASLQAASYLAWSRARGLFVADWYRIRLIDFSGNISTVAGTGIAGSQGVDGPAAMAQIESIGGMAAAPDGTLYFTEPDARRVRKLTTDGRLVLVAGAVQPPGGLQSDGDGGLATVAHLYGPSAIAISVSGDIYVAEQSQKIRRISPSGIITTMAGDGQFHATPGYGDGGPARNAGFSGIQALATDAQGSLYVGECPSPCRIRRIDPSGSTNSIAGGSATASSSTADGPAASTRLQAISSLFVDAQGSTHFADAFGRIRRVTSQATVETLAGSSPAPAPDGPDARQAWLVNPLAIAAAPSGDLYIAESRCRIRKVSPRGAFTTVAGTNNCRTTVQEGAVAGVDLPNLYDLAVTSQGILYASTTNGELFRITPSGTVAIVPGLGPPPNPPLAGSPLRLAVDSRDRLYAVPFVSSRVFRMQPDGSMQALPNIPPNTYTTLALDPSDTLYLTSENDGAGRVYFLAPDGRNGILQGSPFTNSLAVDAASKLYGTARSYGLWGFDSGYGSGPGFRGDSGPLLSAWVNAPTRLIAAPGGGFYLLDSGNRRVRKISGAPPLRPPTFTSAGVVNAASGVAGALAPGELISIYGSDLGPPGGWTNAADNNLLPSVAGYTRVFFDGRPAPVWFAREDQINVFVPYYVSLSPVTYVQVEVDGVLSEPVMFSRNKSNFGIFTADSSGSGQGAIFNQDNAINSSARPADRGSVITFFGTGEGTTSPALRDGAFVISAPYPVPDGRITVTVGGQPAEVLYAGGVPYVSTGVLQLNVRVPASIAPGAQPIVVSVDGVATTRRVTVAVR